MRVREAIEQLDAIHDHLAKAEVYRGFRASAVALTGVLGLIAAFLQPDVLPANDPGAFVGYWVAVALIGAAVGGGAALFAYLFREDEFTRRRTRRVLAQFLPGVAAGGLVTTLIEPTTAKPKRAAYEEYDERDRDRDERDDRDDDRPRREKRPDSDNPFENLG